LGSEIIKNGEKSSSQWVFTQGPLAQYSPFHFFNAGTTKMPKSSKRPQAHHWQAKMDPLVN
jgi:hypothetical protein